MANISTNQSFFYMNTTTNILPNATTTSTTSTSTSKTLLNNSTIKLIQRLLEETSQTGDLILNNKNLNEFPTKIANNFDLSDTITADLSKNHLTEFPRDLCQYDSLEKLYLYSNLIRTIPDISVFQLKCLKLLDLNSNNLTYLPPSLCNLASLQVLTINNNKLVSLPEEIGRLDKLIQLDVSCNEITHLPVQIGDLISLRALNVRRNLLVELPKEISHLKLVNFDCSSNRLSKLPLCFREMVTLIDLVVDHNPLEVPPAHICTKGLLHIMKYLLVEAIKEEKKRGILTEYEINTQYNTNNFNIHNNNANHNNNHQRSSCTNSTGSAGSAGSSGSSFTNNSTHNNHFNSFMFQSSMRNAMPKKTGGSSSLMPSLLSLTGGAFNSNNSSSHSSTSSSSSVVSLNSTHTKNLPPQHPPPPPPPLLLSPKITLPIEYQHHHEDLTNVEFVDAHSVSPEPSLTSSPTSSTSSTSISSSPNFINQNITQNNNKLGSIHELISLKNQTESSNNKTIFRHHHQRQYCSNSSLIQKQQQQQESSNFLKFNQQLSPNLHNSTNTLTNQHYTTNNNNSYEAQQIWRLNSQNEQKHSNFSLVAGLSSSSSGTSSSEVSPGLNSINIVNNGNQFKRPMSDSGFDTNQHFQKNMYTTNPLLRNSNPDPSYNSNLSGHHIIYDESLNPISIEGGSENCLDIANSDSNNVIISIDSTSSHDEYYRYQSQQQQQQQVWIPRDDLLQSPPPNNLLLCNGKELPKEMHNINPAFTIRRHIIQIQEEQKQIETLKKSIESKLKIQLPLATTSTVEEFGMALSDGVILCHLMNQIFPRTIQIIHVPSMTVPKLSLAKCRKNVENFIDACRRLGLQENDMCCAHDIIEAKNLAKIARTVIMLSNYNQLMQQHQQLQKQQNNLDFMHQQHHQQLQQSNSLTTIGNVMVHHSSNQAQTQQQTAV